MLKINFNHIIEETKELFKITQQCHNLRMQYGFLTTYGDKPRKIIHMHDNHPAKPAYDKLDQQQKIVSSLCELIGAEESRVYNITRWYLKWETTCNWELCFPTFKYEWRFMSYLFPDNEMIAEYAQDENQTCEGMRIFLGRSNDCKSA